MRRSEWSFDELDVILAILFAAIVAVGAYVIWYNYRYPCKRYQSYPCTETYCQDVGGVDICTSYDTMCTRCVERFAERPEDP